MNAAIVAGESLTASHPNGDRASGAKQEGKRNGKLGAVLAGDSIVE